VITVVTDVPIVSSSFSVTGETVDKRVTVVVSKTLCKTRMVDA